MARAMEPIEIGDLPELVRLAEEVRATGDPRLLRRGGEDVAVLMPIGDADEDDSGRDATAADDEAFRRAAGSWKGLIDVDKFIRDNHESRRRSVRPPVDL